MRPRRIVVCLFATLGAAGCGRKRAPQPVLAHHADPVPQDAAVAAVPEFPADWGVCDTVSYYDFDDDTLVELADCDVDPATDDDAEARPRNHVAHLVLRRGDDIVSDEELGMFVPWEEGTKWLFPGVIVAPNGTPLALPVYDSGSMGPDSGSYTLHGYVLDGDHLRDIFQISGTQLEITIAGDRSNAQLEICDGSCEADPDKATHQSLTLTFDGTKATAK